MKNKKRLLKLAALSSILFSIFSIQAHQTQAPETGKLESVVAGKHRTTEFTTRDMYRHPVETLKFFGIKDNMTVIEISPGNGWYTEILAPYLKDNGKYIAAGHDPKSKSEYYKKSAIKFQQKIDANPELYSNVEMAIMQVPDKLDFAKPNSADMVLSFRNTHNWHKKGNSEAVFRAIFRALKEGGTFGLVQHRAGHRFPKDRSGAMGYLRQPEMIKLAEKVGFQLVKKSNINANPNDTRDHEKGVWTLPPVYRLKDVDREKYEAIGESDRMTLKFVKPHLM